jgi:flagellar motor protein MotB
MRMRSFLPLLAVAALAVAPGCQNRRARQAPPAMAQAPMPQALVPQYGAPPPTIADGATKADVYRVDDKVTGLSGQVAELNQKLDRLATPAPTMMMPPPTPMPAAEPMPVAAAGDGEAARFAETLRTRGVSADQRGTTVLVRLTDAFRSGSENLKGDVGLAKTLQAVAEGLQVAPTARVQVVGHTDSAPIKKSSWSDNTTLSRARAQTVARVLSENGVRSYIDVDGRGETEPLVSPEKSATDRAKNRRVDIQVTFG